MANTSREACATIRGYNYQFDSTIRAILTLRETEVLQIENLEDFDIVNPNVDSLYQCKYLASAKLTNSIIRDAILPMIIRFHEEDYPQNIIKNYNLYGYFKESVEGEKCLSLSELKNCLKQVKTESNNLGVITRKTINLQEKFNLTDEELELFSRRLKIYSSIEYEQHTALTIHELKNSLGVSKEETISFYYPSAFNWIAHKASSTELSDRTITKIQFIDYMRAAKEVVYSKWYIHESGLLQYHKDLRNKFFSTVNIDKKDRFFIIEITQLDCLTMIFDMVMEIRRKWSSCNVRRKPSNERYAPYIFLNGLSRENLIEIKKILYERKIQFTDGYPYYGSVFDVDNLMKWQTPENGISIRILTDSSALESTLLKSSGQPIVYDFYQTTPTNIVNQYIRKISISIQKIEEIADII